jgi:transcriptional regulator with XRE-family HTH domain
VRRNLKAAIVHAGVTQRALARAVGVHEDRLSEIVTGASEPRVAERWAICRGLNVEDTEALWNDEPVPRSHAVN